MPLSRSQARREAALHIFSMLAADDDWRDGFTEYADDGQAMAAIERALDDFDRRIHKLLAPHLWPVVERAERRSVKNAQDALEGSSAASGVRDNPQADGQPLAAPTATREGIL